MENPNTTYFSKTKCEFGEPRPEFTPLRKMEVHAYLIWK